jgi:PAS domain S-box-containing protein
VAFLGFTWRPALLLQRASYDWSYVISAFCRPKPDLESVVIVYQDEASHREYGQPFNRPWDRALHAPLLEKLTAERARAVVFDIVFSDPGPSAPADASLARAIQQNGKVVLAADWVMAGNTATSEEATRVWTLTLPHEPFLEAAAGWGLAQVQPDDDLVVRQHYHGPTDQDLASLSWTAATLAGAATVRDRRGQFSERWVNYYGGPDTVPHLSYRLVAQMRPGFFRDKVVLVGGRPKTGLTEERKDEFRSPLTAWGEPGQFMPAAEVQATLLLNLLRGDWLTRLPPAVEWLVVLGVAVAFGFGLCQVRIPLAVGLAVVGVVVGGLVVGALFGLARVWFPWLVVIGAQVPAALLWAVSYHSVEWYRQRRALERERRRAQLRIQEQAALLDKAQDAILVHDLQWVATYVNASAERLYGWSSEETLNRDLRETFLRPALGDLERAKSRLLERGQWQGELRQVTKAGRELTVASRWTLVRDEAGQPKAVLVINTDVTEQKLVQEHLLRTQRMDTIGALASGVAHDISNVLSSILMSAQLLQLRKLDEEACRVLQVIEASTKRGAGTLRQIHAFVRGADRKSAELQPFHLIRELGKLVRTTFPKHIELAWACDPDLATVAGDATEILQALLNLCINARDAMPRKGLLRIEAANVVLDTSLARLDLEIPPGEYVRLSVSDTGTGIPEHIRSRIFEPQFTTKESGQGTGLGLPSVLRVARKHGGLVDFETEVGQGSTFYLYLPAVAEPAAALGAASPPEGLVGRGELLLVVDDEAAIRDLLRATLTTYNYRVLSAHDGREAAALFLGHQKEIALAIVDLMMPALDGASVLETLRQFKPELPIISITGALESLEVQDVFTKASGALLRKPFSAEELLAAIKRELGH